MGVMSCEIDNHYGNQPHAKVPAKRSQGDDGTRWYTSLWIVLGTILSKSIFHRPFCTFLLTLQLLRVRSVFLTDREGATCSGFSASPVQSSFMSSRASSAIRRLGSLGNSYVRVAKKVDHISRHHVVMPAIIPRLCQAQ